MWRRRVGPYSQTIFGVHDEVSANVIKHDSVLLAPLWILAPDHSQWLHLTSYNDHDNNVMTNNKTIMMMITMPMADGSNVEQHHHRFRWTTTNHNNTITATPTQQHNFMKLKGANLNVFRSSLHCIAICFQHSCSYDQLTVTDSSATNQFGLVVHQSCY